MKRVMIFLSAPFFNKAEYNFNKAIARKLRNAEYDVWLAQEHPFIKSPSLEEKRKIYEDDIKALKQSDIIVAVLDGIEIDSGVAFEMGYAQALGKPIIGLKTDVRTFSFIENINLMLEVPSIKICKTVEEVIDTLSKLKK